MKLKVKQLAISYDQGKTFIEPSVASAKDKTYPIARPLFYMFDKKNAAKVKTVVDYALSPEGQKNWRSGVYSVGLIKVKFYK
jgi:phosphate transport system substrate-binding protein